jgi:hypothetical protein
VSRIPSLSDSNDVLATKSRTHAIKYVRNKINIRLWSYMSKFRQPGQEALASTHVQKSPDRDVEFDLFTMKHFAPIDQTFEAGWTLAKLDESIIMARIGVCENVCLSRFRLGIFCTIQHDFAEVTLIPRDTIHAHSLDTFFFVASFDLACHTLYGKLGPADVDCGVLT